MVKTHGFPVDFPLNQPSESFMWLLSENMVPKHPNLGINSCLFGADPYPSMIHWSNMVESLYNPYV